MQNIDSLFSLPLSQPVAIFLLVLVIILFSPIIFDRLRIPRIVGLIVAGIIVGPHCLNLLAFDASFKIFGEVGILYLMFMAAIEIDMYHLKRNLGKGTVFGFITYFLPMVAGTIVSRYVFNTGWDTAALLAVMYAAHTLVSYPSISRFGLSSNKGVVIAVAGTIVAVLLALLTLAEVININRTGYFHINGLLRILGWTVVYGIGVAYLFPLTAKYFFRKYSDSIAQFIFILAMVFVSSLIASVIGLEAILGAFFGGLVLNRFVPARSALMGRISFVGEAVFIPYFLIGVGMLINIGYLFNGWDVLFCAVVMSGVALITKWGAVWISRHIYKLSDAEGSMMFGLTSGKAAATIAATMIGYQYGMLTETLMNGAVLMILICCVVATFETERAAKKIRITLTEKEMKEDDSPEGPHPARQLVAVANPVTAETITHLSCFMRSHLNRSVMNMLYIRTGDDASQLRIGKESLRVAQNISSGMQIESETLIRYDLNVVTGLVNTMKECDSTEIVLGLHRKTVMVDTFFGNKTDQLVKLTNKMVILSRLFMPVDTVNSIYVFVPKNAEYETGFKTWITRIAHLAMQIGRKVNFLIARHTMHYLDEYIRERGFEFAHKYIKMESWDDFLINSTSISVDDLFIVIYARKGSLSSSGETDNMPPFLSRHFANHSLVIIYPPQFGEH